MASSAPDVPGDPVPSAPLPGPAEPAPFRPGETGRLRREGYDELRSALRAPFLKPILRLPLKKIVIWGLFLGLLWLLYARGLFGVILLTFVLGYIGSTIVELLISRFTFTSRRIPVLLVFGGLVGAIVGLGFASVPAIRAKLQQVKERLDHGEQGHFLEEERDKLLHENPRLSEVWRYLHAQGVAPDDLLRDALSHSSPEEAKESKKAVIELVQGLIKGVWGGVVTVLMSLLFSFMIVWDAPRLSHGLDRLKYSRLGDVWIAVAPSIATFGRLLGRGFEAQSAIACVNTLLTATGMFLLGIPAGAIGFLSVIVFVCSFVPIVGVWASTVPICAVAVQSGGLGQVLGVVLMVVVVHVIEAYVLNPRIYGAHLKLHPVAVLMVLFVCEQTLGLWGLVLGVPLATYVWRHLILGEAEYVYLPLGKSGASPQPIIAPAPSGESELEAVESG